MVLRLHYHCYLSLIYNGISRAKIQYSNENEYSAAYHFNHNFTPNVFLNSSRPSARFLDDKNEARAIENFE